MLILIKYRFNFKNWRNNVLGKILFGFFVLPLIGVTTLPAVIIETYNIEDVVTHIDKDTLVLFNIAEVITDSTISLGSSPWRKYVRNFTKTQGQVLQNRIHDSLTLFIAENLAHKSVEKCYPLLIELLQDKEIAVAALTGRGRSLWYTTVVDGIEYLQKYVEGDWN